MYGHGVKADRDKAVSLIEPVAKQGEAYAQRIENLLYGDINSSGCDMDHWEIRFIFEDRNLNRRICGYGVTESSPHICYPCFYY